MTEPSIEDFIGVFPKAIPTEICQFFIDKFESACDLGFAKSRKDESGASKFYKDDKLIYAYELPIGMLCGGDSINAFQGRLQGCFDEYADFYEAPLRNASDPIHSYMMKMQKTGVGQGYHVWHFEQSMRDVANRVLTWIVYLNDVDEGGETEMLYQHRRIKPEQGMVVIFPAAFTHTHRGNPPLSNEKYIVTGWYEY